MEVVNGEPSNLKRPLPPGKKVRAPGRGLDRPGKNHVYLFNM